MLAFYYGAFELVAQDGSSVNRDLHLTIEQQIAEGEWVATSVIARGTHQGVWLSMKPTG